MKLSVLDSYEQVSQMAAGVIAAEIRRKPDLVLLAATGNTPVGCYRHIAERASSGELDVSRMRVAQLDEYVGIGPDDERSLIGWMHRILLDPLEIDPQRVIAFDGVRADPMVACRKQGETLRATGVDLAVLGLGPNGHLGFNEPPTEPSAPTRLVELTPASVASNARYWGSPSRVPAHAVTVGMDVILASRRILLIVSGPAKVDILRRMLESPATPANPASLLRLAPEATVIADRQAWPWHNGEVYVTDDVESLELQQSSMTRSSYGG